MISHSADRRRIGQSHPPGVHRARGAASVEYIALVSALFLMMVFSFSLFGGTINTRVGGLIGMVQGKDSSSSTGARGSTVIVANVHGESDESGLTIELEASDASSNWGTIPDDIRRIQSLLTTAEDVNDFVFTHMLNAPIFKDHATKYAVASAIIKTVQLGVLLAEGDVAKILTEIAAMSVEATVRAAAFKVVGTVAAVLLGKAVVATLPVAIVSGVLVSFAASFVGDETKTRVKEWAEGRIRDFINRNESAINAAANGMAVAGRTYFLFTP